MSLWDDEAGYDRDDPKHPDWASAQADRAERLMDEMKIDGSWQRFQAWRKGRALVGLTGAELSLGEFQRQEREDEAEGYRHR